MHVHGVKNVFFSSENQGVKIYADIGLIRIIYPSILEKIARKIDARALGQKRFF